MKKTLIATTVLLLTAIASFSSYWAAGLSNRRDEAKLVEGLSTERLANTLLALRFIEMNDIAEAKRLLQAETNSQLSWIMQYEGANRDSLYVQQQCKTLNTLKQYREKRRLFTTDDWSHLWNLPGMKDEEARRIAFLNNLKCGDEKLYTVE